MNDAPSLPDGLAARQRVIRGTSRRDGDPVDLAVAEVGDPAAPAVVVAHGVGSSARFVAAACGAPLAANGWRLVTYDARGHGASTPCPDPADHHLDVLTSDLAAVVAATGAVRAVGGVSLGGHAALRWAGDLPRVVCLPAWLGPATAGVGPHAAVADEIRRDGIPAVVARLRADPMLPGWLRSALVTDYGRHDEASLTAALLALDGSDAPTVEEVAAVTAPVAVVAWPADPGHPLEVAEAIVAAARDGSLIALTMADLDVAITRFGDAVVRGLSATAR